MYSRAFCVVFMLIFGVGLLQARSPTKINDDFKAEIKQLQTKVYELEQRKAYQDSKINELTQHVSSLTVTATDATGTHSVQKRGLLWRRRLQHTRAIGFLVTLSQHQLVVENDDVISFDEIITDIGNAFDINTGEFKCIIPGTYIFSLSLVAGIGSYLEASIRLNGVSKVTAVSGHRDPESGLDQGSTVAILVLREGDVVNVTMDWPLSPQTVLGGRRTTFAGYLLRKHF